MAHTFENCAEVLTGKVMFSPAKVHYRHSMLNFILNIVPLSKPKDSVIAFFFGLELQLQKSVVEDTQILCHTPCVYSSVQIAQELSGTQTGIRMHILRYLNHNQNAMTVSITSFSSFSSTTLK